MGEVGRNTGLEPVYLSMTDARERFSLSRRALGKLIREGGLRRYRKLVGDRCRYVRRRDLERMLATKRKELVASVPA
jgi:hypothetical protein